MKQARSIAESDDCPWNYSLDCFAGFCLDSFEPVECDLEQVAQLIRYQCFCLDGKTWDQDAYEDILYSRKKFIVEDDELQTAKALLQKVYNLQPAVPEQLRKQIQQFINAN